jgi:hypothetical protein
MVTDQDFQASEDKNRPKANLTGICLVILSSVFSTVLNTPLPSLFEVTGMLHRFVTKIQISDVVTGRGFIFAC